MPDSPRPTLLLSRAIRTLTACGPFASHSTMDVVGSNGSGRRLTSGNVRHPPRAQSSRCTHCRLTGCPVTPRPATTSSRAPRCASCALEPPGYLSVWSSSSAVGGVALDRLDAVDRARLALVGLAGGDHLAVGGDQVEAELAGWGLTMLVGVRGEPVAAPPGPITYFRSTLVKMSVSPMPVWLKALLRPSVQTG